MDVFMDFDVGGRTVKEVKTPKKPLIYYYGIALLVLILFNALLMPMIVQGQICEVVYGTFMIMTENGGIGKVEIEDSKFRSLITI